MSLWSVWVYHVDAFVLRSFQSFLHIMCFIHTVLVVPYLIQAVDYIILSLQRSPVMSNTNTFFLLVCVRCGGQLECWWVWLKGVSAFRTYNTCWTNRLTKTGYPMQKWLPLRACSSLMWSTHHMCLLRKGKMQESHLWMLITLAPKWSCLC